MALGLGSFAFVKLLLLGAKALSQTHSEIGRMSYMSFNCVSKLI